MNKKLIVFSLALILVLTFLASCGSGISQEQYDKIFSDLTAAQAQTQKLQGDLTAAQNKMKQAQNKIEIINDFFVPALKGEFDNMSDADIVKLFLGWRDKVIGIGDTTLTTKLQAIIDSGADDAVTMDFFLYLFESLPKTLD